MKKNMLIELDWLKKQDSEFDNIVSSLKKKDIDINFLEKINPYYINYRNSEVLCKLLSKNKEKIIESENFSTFNLGIISNLNYDFLHPALKAYALKNYIYLNCYSAPYGQTINFLKNDTSILKGKKLDAVLLALDFSSLGYSKTNNTIQNTFHYIKEIVDLVNSQFKTPCIIQNMINSLLNSYFIVT